MPAKFELYKDKAKEFRFRLKASNGQTILASEGYKTKTAAKNGIESVKKNSTDDARYDRKQGGRGKPRFNLMARNGRVIGTSQGYDSAGACEKGITSIKKNAPKAKVQDLTV